MPKYNHAFDVAFSLVSNDPDGNDITPDMLKAALLKRISDLDAAEEWKEACGSPWDTYET